MNTKIDPNKYVCLGVNPKDVASFSTEEIADLEKRLAMSEQERRKNLGDAFERAIEARSAQDASPKSAC